MTQPLNVVYPTNYWKTNQTAFPLLSQVALNHLTMLGASVPSERLLFLLNRQRDFYFRSQLRDNS